MSRKCHFTGRRTTTGRKYSHRGRAKHLGGVGVRTTGKTKRKIKPNIQKVRAVVDGVPKRIRVSTKAIKMGKVVKPLKRAWKPDVEQTGG
ncbi:MAG: 50S ribosomal protein L28 [Planctomycetota bacterium]